MGSAETALRCLGGVLLAAVLASGCNDADAERERRREKEREEEREEERARARRAAEGSSSASASAGGSARAASSADPPDPTKKLPPELRKAFRTDLCLVGLLSLRQARAAYEKSLGKAQPGPKVPA